MQRIVLFLIFISLFVSSKSQNNFFNVLGGPGIGWISGNEFTSENQTIRSIPCIGAEFNGFFSEDAFLSIGVDYMKKGAWDISIKSVENNDTIVTESYTSDFKYLVIPVLFNKRIGSDKISLTLGGGFFTALLLKHEHEVNTGVFNIRMVDNDTEDYNLLDLGLQFRAGLRVMIDEKHYFLLNLNHQMGLMNTTSKTLAGGGGLRTNASFIQAGFGFLL